ncbi:hypothetical protein DLAC_11104 [Tieghemostelium lacteum]|uniref:N-acetyltransferase domain-containing protein n=1 Tax=Tieghemostelium lacteum TaxID=361077 RepID=A0A151Z364_TIELA|nr:hypothetical protein DLAC_11104 [Tieghemostelium lacteum]|eukprot:KYQ88403.1 hypothetical protein DLAC_11104 [Tieghemostelium lacteum]
MTQLQHVKDFNVLINNMKQKGGFRQLYRLICSEISATGWIYFADDIQSPSVVLSVDVFRGKYTVYNNDLESLEKWAKNQNWNDPFLSNHYPEILKLNDLDTRFPNSINGIKIYEQSLKYYGYASVGVPESEIILKHVSEIGGLKLTSTDVFHSKIVEMNEAQFQLLRHNSSSDQNIQPLTIEDAEVVNDHWKYKNSISLQYMRWACNNGISVGYRLDGKLVSWIIFCNDGSIGNLYTLEEYRGRGLAKKIVSKIILNVIDRNMTPYLYIHVDNEASNSLFDSLGFKNDILVKWSGI